MPFGFLTYFLPNILQFLKKRIISYFNNFGQFKLYRLTKLKQPTMTRRRAKDLLIVISLIVISNLVEK